MGKRIKILSSIAVAAVLMSASPASAQTMSYHTRFFSDSSKTTQVGFTIWIGCDDFDNPQYHLVGTQTIYQESEHNGYCYNGSMVPL